MIVLRPSDVIVSFPDKDSNTRTIYENIWDFGIGILNLFGRKNLVIPTNSYESYITPLKYILIQFW
jgi:hypothetical protein